MTIRSKVIGLTAILTPDTDSDDRCTVVVLDQGKTTHILERYETGMVMDGDGLVDDQMNRCSKSKALCIPLTGTLVLHVAAAMIRRGYVCLLRGDGGE